MINSLRPREKFSKIGIHNLTNSELLALIIGFGTKNNSALDIAKKIFKIYPISELSKINYQNLKKFKGIGFIQASKIIAAFELAKRALQNQALTKINTPEKVFQLGRDFSLKKQEYTIAIYLNGRQELIKKKIISMGTANHTLLAAREVFAPALMLPANFVILVHNHPSGLMSPSQNDLDSTQKLQKAAQFLGIEFIDHLIVGKKGYFSFKEAKLL